MSRTCCLDAILTFDAESLMFDAASLIFGAALLIFDAVVIISTSLSSALTEFYQWSMLVR